MIIILIASKTKTPSPTTAPIIEATTTHKGIGVGQSREECRFLKKNQDAQKVNLQLLDDAGASVLCPKCRKLT